MTALQPHVVMIVLNDVVSDSRVKKTAVAVAAAGPKVTVVGFSPTKSRTEHMLGRVRIIRVPVEFELRQEGRVVAASRSYPRDLALVALRHLVGTPTVETLRNRRLRHKLRKRERAVRAARIKLTLSDSPVRRHGPRPLRRALSSPYWLAIYALRYLTRGESIVLRAQALNFKHPVRDEALPARRRNPRSLFRRRGDWRNELLQVYDFELAFAPVIDELQPDLIHAHDFLSIGMAHHAKLFGQAQGRDTKLIYDAHENVRGLPAIDPALLAAYARYEKEHIAAADAVITVSPALADMLQAEHGLPERPRVVLNTPVARSFDPRSRLSVRAAAGLADDVPLLTYSGTIKPQRGVDTLIRALPLMTDVHVALVARSGSHKHVRSLVALAESIGCSEQLHVVDYVDPDEVTSYLRTADVGVHTLLESGNAQIALPNKLFEYLHAGLPVVMSHMPAMAEFVSRHGVGQTFTAGDEADLARACNTVLDDLEQYRRAVAQPGLRDEYSWERQAADSLIPLYGELLGDSVHPIDFTIEKLDYVDAANLTAEAAGAVSSPVAPIHLGVGPRNMGGQARAWAAVAARELPEVAADSFAFEVEGAYIFPAERRISREDWLAPDWQRTWAALVAATYSHLLVELGISPLGRLHGRYFDSDLEFLEQHGIELATVSRGSEVRDPRVHRVIESESPLADPDDALTRKLQTRVDDLLPRIRAFDGFKYVSTLDLLNYVPDAAWLPLVVDLERWTSSHVAFDRDVLVVVHAPTHSRLKGSDLVDAACMPLAERGLIEYRRIPRVLPQDMPIHIADADIVIDQLLIGDYGALACQAMAAGRCVVGHVSAGVRSQLPHPLPIVEARGRELRAVLERLVEDREEGQRAARAGIGYARTFHDGTYSAMQLAPFLGVAWPSGNGHARRDPRQVVAATTVDLGVG